MAGQGPIPTKKPTERRIAVRSVVAALDGPERPYEVYRFSGRQFAEKPKHNPFADAPFSPALTIGKTGASTYGVGTTPGEFGAIEPAFWEDVEIDELRASLAGTDTFSLRFAGNVQFQGATVINVRIPGSPDYDYPLTWVTANYRIQDITATRLQGYLESLFGETIQVELSVIS